MDDFGAAYYECGSEIVPGDSTPIPERKCMEIVVAQRNALAAQVAALRAREGDEMSQPTNPAPAILPPERIAEIEARANAATLSPWVWQYPTHKGAAPVLVHPGDGWLYVLDACRDGFNGATTMFCERKTPRDGGAFRNAKDFFDPPSRESDAIREPKNPDMAFIAHAREDIPALLASHAALERRLAEAERERDRLKSCVEDFLEMNPTLRDAAYEAEHSEPAVVRAVPVAVAERACAIMGHAAWILAERVYEGGHIRPKLGWWNESLDEATATGAEWDERVRVALARARREHEDAQRKGGAT